MIDELENWNFKNVSNIYSLKKPLLNYHSSLGNGQPVEGMYFHLDNYSKKLTWHHVIKMHQRLLEDSINLRNVHTWNE